MSSNTLLKRGKSCGLGHHNCLDIGHGDQCCENTSYCFINKQFQPACCPLGSNCIADSVCKSIAYLCTRTATALATPTVQQGCCGRQCPEPSYFLCDADLGGKCCKFGSECVKDGCVVARTQSATPSETSAVQVEDGTNLNTGEKAAIGLSLGISMLLVLLLGTWLLNKKRVKKVSQERRQSVEELDYFWGDEIHSTELRAVPSHPQTPGDIATPVEIDSAAKTPEVREEKRHDGPFELDGLEMRPPRSPSILPTPIEYIMKPSKSY